MPRGRAQGGFFRKDWFLALVLTLVFLATAAVPVGFVDDLEYMAYDAGLRLTHRTPGATEQIAIVAIDDASIDRLGRWPWSRTVLARLVEKLGAAKARAVALQVFLAEPQLDPGLAFLRQIRDALGDSLSRNPRRVAVDSIFDEAERELDADARLAAALASTSNVYLPLFVQTGSPLGRPEAETPPFVQRNRLAKVVVRRDSGAAPVTSIRLRYPIAALGEPSRGIGHANAFSDRDGGTRSEVLAVEYYGEYYPSLALLLAARQLNLGSSDIEVDLGRSVRIGNLNITTGPQLEMLTGFYARTGNASSAFRTYSVHEVLDGKVADGAFRDKLVIVGASANGVGSRHVTPVDSSMSEPELTASVVASLLNQDFYSRPDWALAAEFGILLLVGLYLAFGLPQMGAKVGALVSLVLLLLLVGSEQFLLVGEKLWLREITPAFLLVIGHLALTTKRYLLTEREKIAAQSDSAETNRMLGLAFQGQGQLDMAWDKFRKLPVDGSVLELVYGLALDFERKRQFNKAASVYDFILRHDGKFRDVAERRKRAAHAEQTVILGASKASSAGGTMILDGVDQKPTLGRYEVERELGKGAMGAVYLGRDPKINRVVAIKTMSLAQEFDGVDLQQARNRFFREAETAGRLNHPNIVTIYDAGEEHDLAYIAMEYLQGKDLTHYVNADSPGPLPWVLEVSGKIADALDYAHRNGVVHRDIKPANIMCLDSDQNIKVTDFGIARITASSRTKTGVVLGTPSYMSPEQVAGQHVDGRADLFSLGVMLYQLVTGHLPFGGDSLATLMYQITNVAHEDPRRYRPDLTGCVVEIINKMLCKDPGGRYQTGAETRTALLACRETTLSGGLV